MLKVAEQLQQRHDLRFGTLMSFIEKVLGAKKVTDPLSWFGHERDKTQSQSSLREWFKRRAEIREQNARGKDGSRD